jgi:hypothetical protein
MIIQPSRVSPPQGSADAGTAIGGSEAHDVFPAEIVRHEPRNLLLLALNQIVIRVGYYPGVHRFDRRRELDPGLSARAQSRWL